MTTLYSQTFQSRAPKKNPLSAGRPSSLPTALATVLPFLSLWARSPALHISYEWNRIPGVAFVSDFFFLFT